MANNIILFVFKVCTACVCVMSFVSSFVGVAKASNHVFNVAEFYLAFNSFFFSMFLAVAEFSSFPYFFKEFGILRSYLGRGMLTLMIGSFGIGCAQDETYLMAIGVVILVYGAAQIVASYTFLSDEIKGTKDLPERSDYKSSIAGPTGPAITTTTTTKTKPIQEEYGKVESEDNQQQENQKERTTTSSTTTSDSSSDSDENQDK
ncbi:golgi apparatus membrane protein tvp15 [Anaeramoeba ignava]|uniref:Golgi apparatus membrane protein tvp15 n=1 Tax=Anaeramoeba ignava TaxID=1746090 RepID=A0A9Q0LGC2_ANAIG|nr:golgi apparatus membrane protein tvp15 [Anaeramoeba ignava]|eukprot:Anaeramoba_ignava/a219073_132.p1 GENE.a219073_132~~a219073_132.p1  ORF type:complete len:204 (-),score=65.70 a219073_132:106-717(-)